MSAPARRKSRAEKLALLLLGEPVDGTVGDLERRTVAHFVEELDERGLIRPDGTSPGARLTVRKKLLEGMRLGEHPVVWARVMADISPLLALEEEFSDRLAQAPIIECVADADIVAARLNDSGVIDDYGVDVAAAEALRNIAAAMKAEEAHA